MNIFLLRVHLLLRAHEQSIPSQSDTSCQLSFYRWVAIVTNIQLESTTEFTSSRGLQESYTKHFNINHKLSKLTILSLAHPCSFSCFPKQILLSNNYIFPFDPVVIRFGFFFNDGSLLRIGNRPSSERPFQNNKRGNFSVCLSTRVEESE